ncbi:MBL fold metallo-hydrolase [Acetonema longum]|uniref:Metallo-beta-lactamase domain-containing protein n=1 Tax=Acetonema longum DSM 6540 TaxID=1009370 RepID=F7NHB1_9FIRM|nr:MBL fold metallo-hydrolase [Acetonema longum]EGO64594.1 hypothetical protein ALO_07283 [Acetonema longum DSM 6540]
MNDKVIIQFLGSGDAFGSGGRLQTCILISGQTQFLIDCGASSMISINQYKVDPNSISTIFLSHLHGDHAGGIPFFVLDAQLNRKRTQPLTIAGPPGTSDWYPRIMEASFPGSSIVERKFPVTIKELEPGKADTVNGISVTPFPVSHGATLTSLALRIGFQGKLITYSGDTEWTDSLFAAAHEAALFIAEAYFFEKKVRNHMDYMTLKEHWHELNAQRIIFTHMNNDMLDKLRGVDIETASDGKIVEI